jgi:hypothetical protein
VSCWKLSRVCPKKKTLFEWNCLRVTCETNIAQHARLLYRTYLNLPMNQSKTSHHILRINTIKDIANHGVKKCVLLIMIFTLNKIHITIQCGQKYIVPNVLKIEPIIKPIRILDYWFMGRIIKLPIIIKYGACECYKLLNIEIHSY